MISRRQALGAVTAPLIAQTRSKRPNLVFILVDDLRWDALGCTGHPFARTPNIDRIAREGVNFRNAFVTTPLCSPARGSFLTGQYVHKHGVTTNRDNAALSHRLETFPKLLHDAGYATGYVGKWHMGTDDSPRPGFDRWVSFPGQGRFDNPPMNVDGKRIDADGYMTDILARHAADFIREKREKPFCLYLAHKAVHGPFTPAERHKADYTSDPILRRPNYHHEAADKEALARSRSSNLSTGRGAADEVIRNQIRCMNSVDESVAAVYDALKDAGKLDNTLILFTSDNGYFWGEHGLGDKRWAYEESIRIPMLARLPGVIRPGSNLNGMALNIDVAPTMLHLAGVEVPKTMHGRSLVPLLRGYRVKWRDSFLAEYFREPNFPRTPAWRAVRNQRWKYIQYPGGEGRDELFDLAADPYELKNAAADPKHQTVAAGLKKTLEQILASTS
jgi:N-acetylglucosamine-6-sulfatase